MQSILFSELANASVCRERSTQFVTFELRGDHNVHVAYCAVVHQPGRGKYIRILLHVSLEVIDSASVGDNVSIPLRLCCSLPSPWQRAELLCVPHPWQPRGDQR